MNLEQWLNNGYDVIQEWDKSIFRLVCNTKVNQTTSV